jgi:hypothetical protein
MTTPAMPHPGQWRFRLQEAGAVAPILALLGVILWLAFSERPVVSEAGTPSVAHDPPRDAISAAHEPEPLFLVVIGAEQSALVREQLTVESSLRRTLGEAPRLAEVVEVRDDAEAATVLEAIRADARGLSIHLGAMAIGARAEAADREVAATSRP